MLGTIIGQGATANVHETKMRGKQCAAKVLRTDTEKHDSNFQDLLMEIYVMCHAGSHPTLVEFYGACLSELGNPVILMELLEGQDLESFLTRQKDGFDLGKQVVYTWSHDLLSALDFLHDRDPIIMHRDVKPANLLLTPARTNLKLTDFGLAKSVPRAERSTALHRSNTGTPRYRAPEVQSTLPVAAYTERADVFSAALVMWYLLAGRRPENDVRTDPRGRPLPVVARWRWRAVSDLLEDMWTHQPELRPSAADCLRRLRAAAPPAPGREPASSCYAWLPWRGQKTIAM